MTFLLASVLLFILKEGMRNKGPRLNIKLSIIFFSFLPVFFAACGGFESKRRSLKSGELVLPSTEEEEAVPAPLFEEDNEEQSSSRKLELCRDVSVNIEYVNAGLGGDIFAQHIDEEFFKDIVLRVCEDLYIDLSKSSEMPPRFSVTVRVIPMEGVAWARAGEDSLIQVNSGYVEDFASGKSAEAIRYELEGVLIHEAVHAFQNGDLPGSVVESVADAIRIKEGRHGDDRRQKGGNWDGAYTVGGFFWVWLEEEKSIDNFIYQLNKSAQVDWSQSAIRDITGIDVEVLWSEYQQWLAVNYPDIPTIPENQAAFLREGKKAIAECLH